jgi:hypothetical protein
MLQNAPGGKQRHLQLDELLESIKIDMITVSVRKQHRSEIRPAKAVPLETLVDESRPETEIYQDGRSPPPDERAVPRTRTPKILDGEGH